MNDAFLEYFRCPGHLSVFETKGDLRADDGYFRFGDAICYGQRTSDALAGHVNGSLPDLSRSVTCDRGRVQLPFDLSAVVTNLRQERYRRDPHDYLERISASGLARGAYYLLRPALPVGVRKHLQRLALSGWERIPFPRWPVDVTVESIMRRAMALVLKSQGTGRIPFIWFWPEGAPGCAVVTHDIEGPAGHEFCDELMDLDDSFGIKSSFQVVPDAPWQTSRETSTRLLERFRRRGFEVNVHDLSHDGRLFRDHQVFLERAAEINRYANELGCRGFRSGAMYREQAWFDAFEFSFDMSVPTVAHLEPQRGGCCTVMPYFVGDVLELPLTTTQDYSLFHILGDYSTSLWKEQIDSILGQSGFASFIAHPDYLIETRARAVYADLLAHLSRLRDEKRLWITLPGEVDRWWRNRCQMTLVADGESWRVEGPDSRRARVAYARLDGDRVVFDVDPAVPERSLSRRGDRLQAARSEAECCGDRLEAARSEAECCGDRLQAAGSEAECCGDRLQAARSEAGCCGGRLQAARSADAEHPERAE